MEDLSPGDHVRLKTDIYDEGIVLMADDSLVNRNHYWVVFCKGTDYNSKPWVRSLHREKLVLINKEVHKPRVPPRFKK
tara:strand:- start:105 stop:338 length:234 start_codon:yes stop_codon:yes gene_type:complete